METRTNEIDRQIRELTKKEGSCWVGIFNQEDEQVHEHRFTADKTGEPTPTLDDYEKLEENIRYLTDDIIHGEFVFQFAQFDDDSDCL
ncbi:MAG: hypothetical protein GTN64_02005, partial [Candidatus Latescibacteria bacterium]|nr:hypothetical protein [Candidatus Latescibacterota bacterium]NIO77389.1 hypothetical protein [Candidatus Latescibacterota bacterium]